MCLSTLVILFPIRVWDLDQLAGYLRQLLLDPLPPPRTCLRKKTLWAVVEGPPSKVRNFKAAIEGLHTLELLQELFTGWTLIQGLVGRALAESG
jgi:hypothetical protein